MHTILASNTCYLPVGQALPAPTQMLRGHATRFCPLILSLGLGLSCYAVMNETRFCQAHQRVLLQTDTATDQQHKPPEQKQQT